MHSPPNRRQFVRQSVLALASLPFLGCQDQASKQPTSENSTMNKPEQSALPYLESIGIQLWTVRDQMALDPTATLTTLRDIGYKQVELGDTRTIGELKPICDDLGLTIKSSFMQWSTITGRWDLLPEETPFEFNEVVDQAGEAGLSHLIFGYLLPQSRETTDDWKRLADQLNEAGLKAKENGLQMAYHNHNFEWDPVEGTTGFDILMERMDGELVPFELDVFWAQIAGQDPKTVLDRIKDRVELLHLKQLHRGTPVVTKLDDVPENAFEELDEGDIPIKELMRYGQELGVQYCMVEQDGNYGETSLKSAQQSLEFLQS
jgi:sugar phosphate isomerase/epimerase